jgi:protein-disulfide isomerase
MYSTSRFHSTLDTLATVLVIIAAVVVIVFTVQASVVQESAPPLVGNPQELPVPTTPHPLGASRILGNQSAKVAIIEYADFECSFCGDFARSTWPSLKKQYIDTGKVIASFRNLPLSGHRHAMAAAITAECAGEQGRFWEMHDLLYEADLNVTEGRSLARQIGLDVTAFDKCSEGVDNKIAADQTLAKTMGIFGTPSFLIGLVQSDRTVKITRVWTGAQPLPVLSSEIDYLLTAAADTKWSRFSALLTSLVRH